MSKHVFRNNNYLIKFLLVTSIFFSFGAAEVRSQDYSDLAELENKIETYDSIAESEVMIFGTSHFGEEVLTEENQKQIEKLVNVLAEFQPTKIVVEWEQTKSGKTNEDYHAYLNNEFGISNKPNEVYQIGFRLAEKLNHDSIYLFDDQTEYIGSLENFSFKSFLKYAKQNDEGFFNKHEKKLIRTFEKNDSLLQSLTLHDRLALMNSPNFQKVNAQRMHMYEIRVGIQKNWIGPDWLGRWYRRNVRMMSNVLIVNEPGDRILIIVGDNHKWTLEMLFENTPEFTVKSSWRLLKKNISQE